MLATVEELQLAWESRFQTGLMPHFGNLFDE